MTARTYRGSCHCGAVRFECALDLAGDTSRCNCSICAKGRFWKTLVKASAMRLLQGETALTDYQFGSKTVHHLFCRTCGIKPFGRANLDVEFGGERLLGEYYAVNLACLDDATPDELAAAPLRYEDGRDDRWDRAPAVTRHL
jgi:hypothetical protein